MATYSFARDDFLFAIKRAETSIDLLEAFGVLARSNIWVEAEEYDSESSDTEELVPINEEKREEKTDDDAMHEEVVEFHEVDIANLIASIGSLKRKKLLTALHTSIAFDENVPPADHGSAIHCFNQSVRISYQKSWLISKETVW